MHNIPLKFLFLEKTGAAQLIYGYSHFPQNLLSGHLERAINDFMIPRLAVALCSGNQVSLPFLSAAFQWLLSYTESVCVRVCAYMLDIHVYIFTLLILNLSPCIHTCIHFKSLK